MLLHRLFDNRPDRRGTIGIFGLPARLAESFRLLDVPSAEQERKRRNSPNPGLTHRTCCACWKNRC